MTYNFLSSLAHTCLPPFKQFIEQQMAWLQDSILKHLHHHILSNMLFDRLFEIHCVWILSCSGLNADVWIIVWLTFPTFWLFSPSFSIVLWMQLGLSHPSIIHILRCTCTHVTTLTLGLQNLWAKNEAHESHFMLLGMQESVREWTPTVPTDS